MRIGILCLTMSAMVCFTGFCGEPVVERLHRGKISMDLDYEVNRYTITVSNNNGIVKKSGDERAFKLFKHYYDEYSKLPIDNLYNIPANAEKTVDYYEVKITDNKLYTSKHAFLTFLEHGDSFDKLKYMVDATVSSDRFYLLSQENALLTVYEYTLCDKPIDNEDKNYYGVNILTVRTSPDPFQITLPKIVAYPNGFVMLVIPYKDRNVAPERDSKILLMQKIGREFVPLTTIDISGKPEERAKATTNDKELRP